MRKKNIVLCNFYVQAYLDSHHPDLHQNVNWFNHFNSWESANPSQHDAKSPVQVIRAQPAIPLASECPTGLCPLGATCSQNSGQWQCACGQNACTGGKRLIS